jgi:Ca2+-binding RTX toxin-like protein
MNAGTTIFADAPQIDYFNIIPVVKLIDYINGVPGSFITVSSVEFYYLDNDFRREYGSDFYVDIPPLNYVYDSFTNIENITGSDNADRIIGDGQNNIIQGSGGSDNIDGGLGNDTIYGDSLGDDSNYTIAFESDIIDGGDGHDEIFGGVGNDIITGGL